MYTVSCSATYGSRHGVLTKILLLISSLFSSIFLKDTASVVFLGFDQIRSQLLLWYYRGFEHTWVFIMIWIVNVEMFGKGILQTTILDFSSTEIVSMKLHNLHDLQGLRAKHAHPLIQFNSLFRF